MHSSIGNVKSTVEGKNSFLWLVFLCAHFEITCCNLSLKSVEMKIFYFGAAHKCGEFVYMQIIHECCFMLFVLNRLFPSYLVPLFQNRFLCKSFHVKMILIA